MTNNEAEYEAWISGITLASDLGVKALKVYNDPLFIVSHLKGEFVAKDSKTALYLEVAQGKSKMCNPFDKMQVPRDQNTQAYALANLGSSQRDVTFTFVLIIHLMTPTVSAKKLQMLSQLSTTKMSTKQVTMSTKQHAR